jgi:hypothetical protein
LAPLKINTMIPMALRHPTGARNVRADITRVGKGRSSVDRGTSNQSFPVMKKAHLTES